MLCAAMRFVVLSAACDKGCKVKLHSLEATSEQVDGGIAASMECVTVNSVWNVLHSR